MSGILQQLEINQTVFYQMALFFVGFILLSQIYLKPFQRLIEKRRHKLKNEVEGAAELLRSVESKIAEYEKTLHDLRTEARQNYEKSLGDARSQEDLAVNQYRAALKKEYQEISQKLSEEKKNVEGELKTQLSEFADGVAQKLLSGK